MTFIEIKINKEVRDYQESIFFGLSLRQLIFSALALGIALGLYFFLRRFLGTSDLGWICIVAAFPFALCGFFHYNGMTFEQFLLTVIRSQLLYPSVLTYRGENLYAKVLEHSSLKEVLQLD